MIKKSIGIIVLSSILSCKTTKTMVVAPKKDEIHKKHPDSKHKIDSPNNSNENKTNSKETPTIGSKVPVTNDVIVGYISLYKDIAIENMQKYKIPASIILAQGILESGAGQGNLAILGNNHFGIKCHNDWIGETVQHDDDAPQECFRKYTFPSESYRDHALFLTKKNRYSKLFNLNIEDYKSWAKELKAAGYATDPKYPDKLISYIERFKLDQYDKIALGKNVVPKPIEKANGNWNTTQNTDFYEVQKGDTFYSISKKFNLQVEELKQKNNISTNTLSIGQKLIIK